MKRNIYLTTNQEITRSANVLKIDDKKLPISMIHNIFVIGKSKISTSAINLLLKNSKTLFYLNNKYELTGILTPPIFNSDYNFRLAQYKNKQNLNIAKFIVNRKIQAIEKFTNKNLDRYKNKLQEVSSLQEILGVEGSSSIYMYKKFKELLKELGIDDFKKREYRPTKDKVNSLLSFLYTLYYSFSYSEVISYGYDPYISFLHIKRGKHAAFVSDVMEEARIYLTELAVDILKEIYEDGFDGIYLNYEARKVALHKFDEFIQSYENSILKDLKGKLC